MITYKDKYLKYKNKYLQLKYLQKGSGPLNNIIKNIGLFEKKSDIDNFLNPIYGFIYFNTSFIKNHKKFFFKDDIGISSFINTNFHELGDHILPTDKLLNNKDFRPKDIGIILGFLYYYKIYYNILNYNINKIKETKKTIMSQGDTPERKKQLTLEKKIQLEESIQLESLLNKRIREIKDMTPDDKYNLGKNKLIKSIIDVIKNNIDDKDFFRSILAILWHNSTDKQDIKEYYEGINESFDKYNTIFNIHLPNIPMINIPLITIPENYINDLYNDELNLDKDIDFEEALYIADGLLSNILPIYNQFGTTYEGNSFPDCGESVIRSFINIIFYDKFTKTFNIDLLTSKGASQNLIDYYIVFNNFSKQTSIQPLQIFGQQMNARAAWAIVVSNLSNVRYGMSRGYDISGDTDGTNFLNVMKALFKGIRTLNDFVNHIEQEKQGEQGEQEEPEPIINIVEHKIPTTININYNGNYKITIQERHYTIESIIKESKTFNYLHLGDEEKNIINIFLNKSNIYININENFYFIKWDNDNLIKQFNNFYNDTRINNVIYTKIFDYLYKKYKDFNYEILRIHVNIFKILPDNFSDKVKKYSEISKFGYIFDIHYNLIKIKFNINEYLGDSLNNLTNLQELTFFRNFNNKNKSLGESLKGLISLKKLNFPEEFNNNNEPLRESLNNLNNLEELIIKSNLTHPFGNSLDRLSSLKILELPDKMSQVPLNESLNKLITLQKLDLTYYLPLGTSLNGLINLKQLDLTNDKPLEESLNELTNLEQLKLNYNLPINTSFNNLINLKILKFGYYFNMPLENSLNRLINLEELELSTKFNKPLGNSLNGLIKLKILKLNADFNESLGDSLNSLINLEKLHFGYSFNKPLGNSLNELIKLKILNFGQSFNESLSDSLNRLTNLEELYLGFYFNKPLGNSLNELKKLKKLKFESMFRCPLEDSLINLIALEELSLHVKIEIPSYLRERNVTIKQLRY